MAFSVGSQDKKTVSAVAMLDKRDIYAGIVDIYSEDDFMDILNLMGRAEKLDATQWDFHNFVDEKIHSVLTSSGTVTGSGTATVSVAVTPVNIARVGDLVNTAGGRQAQITAVTRGASDTITFKTNDNAAITFTTGDKLSIVSRAEFENSDAPENRRFTPTKYMNKVQIFSEVQKITDVELQNQVEVAVNGKNYIVDYDAIKKVQLLKASVSGQFIAGEMSADSFSDSGPTITNSEGYTSQKTRGLHSYIALYGVSDAVATLGTVAKTDIDDLVNQLVANRTPSKSYFQMGGTKTIQAYENYLKGTSNTGINSARLSVDGKEIDFTVDKYKAGGIEFQIMRLPILDNPDLFNYTGNIYNRSMYFVPADKVKTVGGPAVGRIRIRYKKQSSLPGLGNDMIKEAYTGMYANGSNSLKANAEKRWLTAQALECLGVQHFARQTVLAAS